MKGQFQDGAVLAERVFRADEFRRDRVCRFATTVMDLAAGFLPIAVRAAWYSRKTSPA